MANPCKFQLPGEERWMTEDEFKQRLSEGLLDKLMVDNNISIRGIKPDKALAESYGKQPEIKTTTEQAKSIADAVRGMKIKPGALTGGDTGVALSSVPGFEEAWNSAVEVVAKAIEVGGEAIENVQKAFDTGWQEIKNSDWYNGLDREQKKQAYKDYYKGMDERFPKQPVSRATRAAGKEFATKVEEATGLAPEEKTVQMTPGEALKKRIKDLIEGGKLGAKAIQDIKKQVRDYAQENLPADKYSKSEVKRIMNAITNSTENNLDKVIDRIDNLILKKEGQKVSREAKAAEAKRIQTARKIAKMAKDKKTLYTKVNGKWVGKVTIDAQKEFKEFIQGDEQGSPLDNLESKTQEELDAILEVMESIRDTGRADFKRMKEISDAAKRRENAELLEGLVAGTNIGRKEGKKIEPTILNGQEEIEDFLKKGGAVIIDGQLYTSSSFANLAKSKKADSKIQDEIDKLTDERNQLINEANDKFRALSEQGVNPSTDSEYNDLMQAALDRTSKIKDLEDKRTSSEEDTELEDVSFDKVRGYEQRNMTVVKEANLPTSKNWLNRTLRVLNPINAINDVYSLLEKASAGNSKVRKFLRDNIATPLQNAYVDRLEETTKKINDYNDGIANIFGSKKKALNRLSDVPPSLNVIKDRSAENINTTNSHLVSYYNLSRIDEIPGKRESGIKRLEKSGVDVNKVINYIEANPDLKEYADFLMDKYVDFKSDYEPLYAEYTNTTLPEGVYYPEYAANYEGDFIDLNNVMDSEGNFNALSAVSNNMKQRTTYTGPYNLRMDAHRTMLDYIKNMEHAKAMMPIAKKVNQLFNKQNSPFLVEALGTDGFKEMHDALAVVLSNQSPTSINSKFSGLINSVASLSVLGTLGFKLASIPKQFTSFTHFWTAGIKDGIAPTSIMTAVPTNKDEWDLFQYLRNSEYMKDRWKGGSVDLEMKRIVDKASKSQSKNAWDEMMKAAMLPVRTGDRAAILFGPGGGSAFAIATYRKKIAEGMSKEEAMDYAYKRFVTESERTQQSTREDITSNIQRDPIFRLMGMYRTGQMSMSKKVVNGVRTLQNAAKMDKNEGIEARRKAISDEEIAQATVDIVYYSTVASMAFAAVSSGAIKLLWDGGGYDDDDKKRMYYDMWMDQINSDLQGYGAMGFIADWALNTLRGDDWKNTIPALKSIKNFQDAKGLIDVPGREWNELDEKKSMELINEGAFLNEQGVMNQWSPEEYDKLVKEWDNSFIWYRMTDAEKQAAVKTIGAANLRNLYNNISDAIEGNKDWSNALMNWEDDYFKMAEEKKKRDRLFEFIYGEPYIKPKEYEQGPSDALIPDYGIPNSDLFELPIGTDSKNTPQLKNTNKKY